MLGSDCGFSRHEKGEDESDEQERGDITIEMAMVSRTANCLYGHDDSVDDAGPDGEPNQAAMRKRILGGENQKNAKRRIDAHDHFEVLVAGRIPHPSRRPRSAPEDRCRK